MREKQRKEKPLKPKPRSPLRIRTVCSSQQWRWKLFLLGNLAYASPFLLLTLLYSAGVKAVFPILALSLFVSWWFFGSYLAPSRHLRHEFIRWAASLLPMEVIVLDKSRKVIEKDHLNWSRASRPKSSLKIPTRRVKRVELRHCPFEEIVLLLEGNTELRLFSRNFESRLSMGEALFCYDVEALAMEIAEQAESPCVEMLSGEERLLEPF